MCSVSAFQTCSSPTTATDGEVIGENLAMYFLCAWKPGLCAEGNAVCSVQRICVYKHHPGCAWEQGMMAGLIPSSSPNASSGKGAGSWRFDLKMKKKKKNPWLVRHCVLSAALSSFTKSLIGVLSLEYLMHLVSSSGVINISLNLLSTLKETAMN